MNAPRTPASNASCRDCAVDLRPSPRNRLGLLAGSWFSFWFGALLVAHTPAPLLLRAALVAGWLCIGLRALHAQAAGFRQVSGLRLYPGGQVRIDRSDGSVGQARLAAGSRLFGRHAWLRIRHADGRVTGECLSAADCGAENWRRFSLLWQYGGLFE